ncbi:hypothetical protein C8R45DRAFT_1222666 [Mycena sanguinolenta]|nr:hypothetical protein C8R45DRAFT_1222666 [Mycena sanguinolenta]
MTCASLGARPRAQWNAIAASTSNVALPIFNLRGSLGTDHRPLCASIISSLTQSALTPSHRICRPPATVPCDMPLSTSSPRTRHFCIPDTRAPSRFQPNFCCLYATYMRRSHLFWARLPTVASLVGPLRTPTFLRSWESASNAPVDGITQILSRKFAITSFRPVFLLDDPLFGRALLRHLDISGMHYTSSCSAPVGQSTLWDETRVVGAEEITEGGLASAPMSTLNRTPRPPLDPASMVQISTQPSLHVA